MTAPARLRMSRTMLLPVVVFALCLLPVAFVSSWALLVLLLLAMAAVYALQALIVFRLARSGRRDRQGEPAAALV